MEDAIKAGDPSRGRDGFGWRGPDSKLPSSLRVPPILSELLDVFVALLEPLMRRFVSSTRWVAVAEAEDIAVYEVRNGHETLRARLSALGDGPANPLARARGGAVELRLPPDQILHRTLRLPQAGRDFLGQIIEHRLERLTPWTPEKVLYGFRVVGEADREGSIAVAFTSTSSDIVADAVRRLQRLGLDPTAVGAATEPIGAPLEIDLYRGQRSRARSELRRMVAVALAIAVLVLTPACLISFWLAHASEQRATSIETRLKSARAKLQASMTGGAAQVRGQDQALIEAKRAEGSIIALIDRLSAALPSNTFLRELDIDPAKVRLVGRSGDAPALIGLLEANHELTKVQFTAPVTRDSQNRDDFEIVATRARAKPEAPR